MLTEALETSCSLARMERNTDRGKYNWAFYRTLREFRKSAFPTFYLPKFNEKPTYYVCIEKEEIKENYHFYFYLEAHPSIWDESGLKETGESTIGCLQPPSPKSNLPSLAAQFRPYSKFWNRKISLNSQDSCFLLYLFYLSRWEPHFLLPSLSSAQMNQKKYLIIFGGI